MKRTVRFCVLAALMVLGIFMCVQSASAASAKGWQTVDGYTYYYKSGGTVKTGWLKLDGNTYYLRKSAEGDAPKGSMVTGFYRLNGVTYYFNSQGVRQSGWQEISGDVYYFKANGKMMTGRKKVDGYGYYFSSSGVMQTGWQTFSGKRYYYKKSGDLGKKGRKYADGFYKIGGKYYYFKSSGAVKTGWAKVDGKAYYFNDNGVMQTGWKTLNGKTYYLGSDGARQTGICTVDGKKYYFNSNGVMKTGWQKVSGEYYYFDESGVMQTGWLTVNGNTYYLNASGVRQTGWTTVSGYRYFFDANGLMLTDTTVDGIYLDEKGRAQSTEKYSILLVSGHGQGDPGATSTIDGVYYEEDLLTREFTNILYQKLSEADAPVTVTMYNQNYDWYQVNTGKASGPSITWSEYDYILEVHFNASSSKDLKGDGSYMGMGIYVHSSSSDVKVDKAIISSVKAETGFKIWGGGTGIFYDSSLANPKLAEQHGVPYGLLETCFIDDWDDMNFYNTRKYELAGAVADGILDGLGA